MGFEPGHKLSTGRPQGSVNQRTRHFQQVLAKHEFDLAEALMDVYKESIKFYQYSKDDPVAGPPALRIVLDAVKEIAHYSQPKLKPVEDIAPSPLEGMSQKDKLALLKEAVANLESELQQDKALVESP